MGKTKNRENILFRMGLVMAMKFDTGQWTLQALLSPTTQMLHKTPVFSSYRQCVLLYRLCMHVNLITLSVYGVSWYDILELMGWFLQDFLYACISICLILFNQCFLVVYWSHYFESFTIAILTYNYGISVSQIIRYYAPFVVVIIRLAFLSHNLSPTYVTNLRFTIGIRWVLLHEQELITFQD